MNPINNRCCYTDRDPSFAKEYYDSSRIVTDFTGIIINQPIVLFLLVGDENQISKVQDLVNNNFPKLKAV